MTDKQIEVTDYGIYLLSPNRLSEFLLSKNSKSNKVLNYFQKNHEVYLESLEKGIWIPVLPLDSIEYIIKSSLDNDGFNNEWEELIHYQGFNIDVYEDKALWIGSFGNLLNWDKAKFLQKDVDTISYETLDGEKLNSAFKFTVGAGKYLVSIRGYRRKEEAEYPEADFGFLFEFNKVDSFEGFNDPREDEKYNFNIAGMD